MTAYWSRNLPEPTRNPETHELSPPYSRSRFSAVESRSRMRLPALRAVAHVILPEGVEDRAGVRQARHVHGLLVRGLEEYERAFPGFERLAVDKGATFHDHTWDFVVLRPQGWQPRYRSELKFLSASRELIESCVRDLFRKLPKVELRERVAVTGLKISREGGNPRCVG